MTVAGIGYFRQVLCDYASHSLMVNIIRKVASSGPGFEVI
jgi:hypothetical protein